jgi:hypothetical protein
LLLSKSGPNSTLSWAKPVLTSHLPLLSRKPTRPSRLIYVRDPSPPSLSPTSCPHSSSPTSLPPLSKKSSTTPSCNLWSRPGCPHSSPQSPHRVDPLRLCYTSPMPHTPSRCIQSHGWQAAAAPARRGRDVGRSNLRPSLPLPPYKTAILSTVPPLCLPSSPLVLAPPSWRSRHWSHLGKKRITVAHRRQRTVPHPSLSSFVHPGDNRRSPIPQAMRTRG